MVDWEDRRYYTEHSHCGTRLFYEDKDYQAKLEQHEQSVEEFLKKRGYSREWLDSSNEAEYPRPWKYRIKVGSLVQVAKPKDTLHGMQGTVTSVRRHGRHSIYHVAINMLTRQIEIDLPKKYLVTANPKDRWFEYPSRPEFAEKGIANRDDIISCLKPKYSKDRKSQPNPWAYVNVIDWDEKYRAYIAAMPEHWLEYSWRRQDQFVTNLTNLDFVLWISKIGKPRVAACALNRYNYLLKQRQKHDSREQARLGSEQDYNDYQMSCNQI